MIGYEVEMVPNEGENIPEPSAKKIPDDVPSKDPSPIIWVSVGEINEKFALPAAFSSYMLQV